MHELVDALALKPGDFAIDCTAGGGGHTALLLERVGESGLVMAIDRDPVAIAALKTRFHTELAAGRLVLVHTTFSNLAKMKLERPVAGICADIGVSSPQLDEAERGFSFMRDGPLDMRMDQSKGMSAAEIVNQFDEKALADLIYKYGEEPKSRIIARKIVQARSQTPFMRTHQLAEFIDRHIHYRQKSRTHKATRTFQALRIAVNEELIELEHLITGGFDRLASGGRMAIISFHSLEDRIIKHEFRRFCGKLPNVDRTMRHIPVEPPPVAAKIIKPFPQTPSALETSQNPRARSAKLRCIEKI